MSERDSDTGQFTAAPEQLFGQAGIEADYGAGVPGVVSYKPMDAPEREEAQESDLRTEAARLAESRVQPDPVVDLGYRQTGDGSPTPQNKTISLNKAASDISSYHAAEAEVVRATDDADIARYVDGMRAELLSENPEIAKELGLSKEEVAAAEAAKAETSSEMEAVKSPAEPTEADPYSDIEGLDEPTKQAMRVPQIREAVEKEFSKAAETQQAYTTGLQQSQQVARATMAAAAVAHIFMAAIAPAT